MNYFIYLPNSLANDKNINMPENIIEKFIPVRIYTFFLLVFSDIYLPDIDTIMNVINIYKNILIVKKSLIFIFYT